VFRITRRGRGRGRAPVLSVVQSGARLEVREGRYGHGALYAYCDVDDSIAAHTLLLAFADMRARCVDIHVDIPVISEQRFFNSFRAGAGPQPDSDPDSDAGPSPRLPDADADPDPDRA